MSFTKLGLDAPLLKALQKSGYTEATPIQAKAIPEILAKKDLLAAAQTGTGKTAGFTLPLLQSISQSKKSGQKPLLKALIITPTRELADQVATSVKTYSEFLDIRSSAIYGGVGINPQKAALRKGIDILTATPGRLLDHIGQKTIDLSNIEYLVLDEADRMLDMGFINDIKKVMALLPKKRQTLLFSATFSPQIKALSKTFLTDPAIVTVAKDNEASAQISQLVHTVDKDRKKDLLIHLINKENWQQVLVFTKTKHGANRLCESLNKARISAAAIHGNKSQAARTRALSDLKNGKVRVLVATDVAARGIDIDKLSHVINYELPNISEDYVHRIGRTGRAGNVGKAISLVCGEEFDYLEGIEKLMKKTIVQESVEGFTSKQAYAKPPKTGGGRGRGSQKRDSRGSHSRAQKNEGFSNRQRRQKNYR